MTDIFAGHMNRQGECNIAPTLSISLFQLIFTDFSDLMLLHHCPRLGRVEHSKLWLQPPPYSVFVCQKIGVSHSVVVIGFCLLYLLLVY